MVRGTQHHIVWASSEGAVILDVHTAEGLPAHQMLRKFKRAVLYQFTVQSAVGSIVDILKEDTVHGILNGSPQAFCVNVHHVI